MQAVELDPNLVPARLRVAELLLEDKQPLDALPHLEMLHAQFPEHPEVLARLGQCRFLQGQGDEARQLLLAARKGLPEDPLVLLYLARLELQEGRAVEAEEWLRRALKAAPADTEAHYALVSALQLQGRRKEAAEALQECEKNKVLL